MTSFLPLRTLAVLLPLCFSVGDCFSARAQPVSTEGTGTAIVQDEAKSDYSGSGDWHLDVGEPRTVRPWDRLEFAVEVQIESFDPAAEIFSCIRVLDANRRVIEERFAPVAPDYTRKDRQTLSGRFVVPAGGAFVSARLWGQKAARVLAARPVFKSLPALPVPSVRPVALSNKTLQVTVHPNEWRFAVRDKRNGHTWQTFATQSGFRVTGVQRQTARSATFSAVYLPEDAPLFLTVALDAAQPQFSLRASMSPSVRMPSWVAMLNVLPAFYQPSPTTELVVPLGEGFLYPTNSATIPSHLLQLSDGSGLTMPWFGIADKKSGVAAMCFTADENDALARLYYRSEEKRAAGMVSLDWMSQRGKWGYDRTATFWFADKGGYVELAKRYRREAALSGKLVTLAEKSKQNPRVADLLGAPNFWFNFLWHTEKPRRMEALRWLHQRGVNRAILSNSDALDYTREIDLWGWLGGQYDLYSDIWAPRPSQKKKKNKPIVIPFGYPDFVQVRANGAQMRGWVHKAPEGDIASYVLCPKHQAEWARKRVPPTMAARKQTSRLIDVTAATALGECYHPDHPMSRTDDKAARLNLLRTMRDSKLVVGSEMGVDWALPYMSYSEGMMSPVPYRHPEAGYLVPDMKPVENTQRYQLNPAVRAPLWELVFRDCSVSYWYWGDATNTFPELWPRRNAFNALYATPPLYMILRDESMYLAQRDRIVATDKFLKPIFAAVGFSTMNDHRFLSDDRMLQQSVFSNGATITVNFADAPRPHAGTEIPAGGYHLQTAKSAVVVAQKM